MSIVELKPKGRKADTRKRPATVVAALLDDACRARLADDVVNRVREFASYGDRLIIWKGIVQKFRDRAKLERAAPDLVARGLDLLSADVRKIMAARDAVVAEAIAWPFELTDAAPTSPAEILRFPGDPEHKATAKFERAFQARVEEFKP
ncbi:hypothetical protein [Aureimonas pseudogalii]|uniref:Uncharacterized protein n=1 Tax=Aureimonas pseudogalii TaxID=1744844 RepID=A0A7W6MJV1_9HYPH|nr:hypothetical protein [Aureimonas pseudogalii]MBB3998625.1 hypothetical protein [Aureimonas pseudogalii]